MVQDQIPGPGVVSSGTSIGVRPSGQNQRAAVIDRNWPPRVIHTIEAVDDISVRVRLWSADQCDALQAALDRVGISVQQVRSTALGGN
jgi:hypothetical protein